jgi:hypothetical protein
MPTTPQHLIDLDVAGKSRHAKPSQYICPELRYLLRKTELGKEEHLLRSDVRDGK